MNNRIGVGDSVAMYYDLCDSGRAKVIGGVAYCKVCREKLGLVKHQSKRHKERLSLSQRATKMTNITVAINCNKQ